MPMYEYHCQDCGWEFEKIVRFSDADLNQPCPRCGAVRTDKKISAVAAIGSSADSGGASLSGASCGTGGRFT